MPEHERIRLEKAIRMDKFEIFEVSAVDAPANEHAKVTILKRRSDAPAGPLEVLQKRTPRRELGKVERQMISQDRSRDLNHDPATQKVLAAGYLPLTSQEQEFHSSLAGEERRSFLLAKSHTDRTIQIMAAKAAAENEDEMMTKFAATASEAAAFDKFREVVKKMAAEEGLSQLEAMQEARKRYPDLLEKGRYAESSCDDPDIRKAVDDGRAKQARIDEAVAKRMVDHKTLTKMEALHEVRAAQPHLFED